MRDDEMVNFEPAEYMREMFFSFSDTGSLPRRRF